MMSFRLGSAFKALPAVLALSFVAAPALSQTESKAPTKSSAPVVVADPKSLAFDAYLKQMSSPVTRYLKIMIDLVPLQEPPYDDANKILEADQPEALIDALGKIAPPIPVADLHEQMKESLDSVEVFLKNGGLPKIGFSKALGIAQNMREISERYHAEILKNIEAAKLPKTDDPFLMQQTKPTTKTSFSNTGNLSVIIKSGYAPVEKETSGRSGSEGFREAASGNFDLKDSHYDKGSMINGVTGSMGMSGLFNGLGGTGTNGLVDGYGFSSGLNGYVNGAGQSSGTSGFFNDMNVMSPSSSSSSSGSGLRY